MEELKGSKLEDFISKLMKECGYLVFTRTQVCDVIAWRKNLSYLIECKGYSLGPKQQFWAIRQLTKNYTRANAFLKGMNLKTELLIKVLIAYGFSHTSKKVFQFTPEEFVKHMRE